MVSSSLLASIQGFLRFDELIHVRVSDLHIASDMMKIKIPHSKMDQYRQGDEILIARSFTSRCPMAILEWYMAKAKVQLDDKEFLFRGIIHTTTGERLRPSGNLSYTTMREVFKKKLRSQLRSLGCTVCARVGPLRLLPDCRHGRWKSETAKDGYVEDPVESHLAVSRNIGL